MPEQSAGERSLPASPHKRQKAREEGNVAKSQDLSAAWSLLAALLILRMTGASMFTGMIEAMRRFLGDAWSMTVLLQTAQPLTAEIAWRFAACMLPFALMLLAAGTLINVAQVGVLFSPQAIRPKLERLNPFSGFRKFFSVRSSVELVKSVLKLAIVTYIVYLSLRDRWEELLWFGQLSPWGVAKAVGHLVFLVWLRVVIAMLALGVLDYGFQRWRHEQDLRMTVQEAREEMRQFEGDPRLKQRIRGIQRQMAMQRMMKEVPKAEVVITNPTTYAVALRYDMAAMDAPRVIAKGARLLADRIRQTAMEHNVPIVERPELARTLYRTLEVGQSIPEGLFRAVAEVLAFVYQIDRRAEKVRERSRGAAAG